MSKAQCGPGVGSLKELDTDDLLDQFVTDVLTTSDLMQMASEHEGSDVETLGRAASNLWSAALYVRRRLDREIATKCAKLEVASSDPAGDAKQ